MNQNTAETSLQNPPLSYTILQNKTLIGKGIAFDCIDFIRDKYEFTYSVVLPEEDILGNISATKGVFGMLASNVKFIYKLIAKLSTLF